MVAVALVHRPCAQVAGRHVCVCVIPHVCEGYSKHWHTTAVARLERAGSDVWNVCMCASVSVYICMYYMSYVITKTGARRLLAGGSELGVAGAALHVGVLPLHHLCLAGTYLVLWRYQVHFSESSFLAILYGEDTWALTFENFWQHAAP
jgi:hypothetical protein